MSVGILLWKQRQTTKEFDGGTKECQINTCQSGAAVGEASKALGKLASTSDNHPSSLSTLAYHQTQFS
jgi:hypothetical protein